METKTFALITPTETHYLDIDRKEGDERSWREIVLDLGLEQGLIEKDEMNASSVLPAVRPSPPKPIWR